MLQPAAPAPQAHTQAWLQQGPAAVFMQRRSSAHRYHQPLLSSLTQLLPAHPQLRILVPVMPQQQAAQALVLPATARCRGSWTLLQQAGCSQAPACACRCRTGCLAASGPACASDGGAALVCLRTSSGHKGHRVCGSAGDCMVALARPPWRLLACTKHWLRSICGLIYVNSVVHYIYGHPGPLPSMWLAGIAACQARARGKDVPTTFQEVHAHYVWCGFVILVRCDTYLDRQVASIRHSSLAGAGIKHTCGNRCIALRDCRSRCHQGSVGSDMLPSHTRNVILDQRCVSCMLPPQCTCTVPDLLQSNAQLS